MSDPQRQLQVQLRDGTLAMCLVVDVGQFVLGVEHEGERFTAERKLGAWREVPHTREPANLSR